MSNQIIYRSLDEVTLLEKNPRSIKERDFKSLCKSLRNNPEHFDARPLILSNRTGQLVIIAGNMRYRAATEIGMEKVPTILIEGLDEAREKEIIIRDNVNNGEWDFDMLANEYETEMLADWGVDLPAIYTQGEPKIEASDDGFEMPNEVKTDIKLGDLFRIGNHRLLCGDATKPEDYLRLMGGELADLLVTDPPYNVDYVGKTKKKLKIDNDSMSDGDFYKFLFDFYTCSVACMKPGGVFYIWHADSEGHNFRKAMHDCGVKVRQCLVWVKNSLVMGRQDYHWKHEPCLYGWKEGAAHNWQSDRKQTTVLEFDRPSRNAEHPTMKPVPLIGYQINNSSEPGNIVLDPFGGSGTTMVACHQINREARIMEISPEYCQVIIDRIKALDSTIEIEKL
jgi:site-specific DNA-methyltransferase (adenine-specific)